MRTNIFLVSIILFTLFNSCNTDDVIEETEEICPRNVDIGLEALSPYSATIKWLETQGFASNYEYGEKGFVLGTGVKGNTSDENVELKDLKPNTEYDFYLQSICTAEIVGEFITNPYTFTTLTCYELNADNLGFIGYVENGDFNSFWIPNRNAEEWQVAMLVNDNRNPTEAQIYTVEPNVNRFNFPDIEPNVEYTFFVRGKCNDVYGEWVTKNINTGDENLTSPCKAVVSNVYDDGYNINFYVNTLSSYVVEVVEENTEKETGLTFEGYFDLNKRTFHNEYSDYVKADTNYDIFVRVACGSSFSEYAKVLTYRSPIANVVFITESSVVDDQLQLSWPDYHYGFNYEYCQSYDQVIYEIEYGQQGFIEGEGVLIEITNPTSSGASFSYNLPLSNFESGNTYEFSIRSVVNGKSRSGWNSLNSGACNRTNKDRHTFTMP
ncbi:fibronectin type III domain-containing protein [Maribacter sp. SA7]|uniref:fibronectin type III domain-containing protein n=1 Tax=Maribacter zhoushanensis TaxID=3030012 RepID=UPI0023EDF46D|nr:fibronectin type III domain-containing protein [Maribacter zhoushanensis]MDF4201486.1 fibronectin type III domain-containing protein [Maribacter zhoushanensis]